MKTILIIALCFGFFLSLDAQIIQKNNRYSNNHFPYDEFISTIAKSNLVVTHVMVKPDNFLGLSKDEDIFKPAELRIFSLSAVEVIQLEYKFQVPGKINLEISNDNGNNILQKEILYNGVFQVDELDMTSYPAGFYQISLVFTDAATLKNRSGKYTVHKIH